MAERQFGRPSGQERQVTGSTGDDRAGVWRTRTFSDTAATPCTVSGSIRRRISGDRYGVSRSNGRECSRMHVAITFGRAVASLECWRAMSDTAPGRRFRMCRPQQHAACVPCVSGRIKAVLRRSQMHLTQPAQAMIAGGRLPRHVLYRQARCGPRACLRLVQDSGTVQRRGCWHLQSHGNHRTVVTEAEFLGQHRPTA